MKLFTQTQEGLKLDLTSNIKYIIIIYYAFSFLDAQNPSGREYRRTAIHNGNQVKTVFGNWGVIGQPAQKGPRGAWKNPNNGYIGDVSPLIGAEVTTTDSLGEDVTFHSVLIPPVDRPTSTGMEDSPTGKTWTMEPVSGYFNENQEGIAISTNPTTWPNFWPDKLEDINDPGWQNEWNGFFGKDIQNIQQESFFVMDDNNDEEFNFAEYNMYGVNFKPDSLNALRNGLGLEIKVRGMQWQQFLAQDCIFWLYEVTNTSTTDYDKVVFGMLVGTYVGVTSTEGWGEYDDDWSFFDVNENLTFTGDFDNDVSRNPKWVGPVGMVGYSFLESPGNPYDGIDNDGDYEKSPFEAPLFIEEDFDSTTIIETGRKVIKILDDYSREEIIISDEDTVKIQTRGSSITIIPGSTKLVEGNVIISTNGKEIVNPNAFDGIDNDLDGLIDENYFLHYRQRKVDQLGVVLFDIINPRAYIDYINGLGLDNSMIDEQRFDGIDNDNDWDPDFDDLGSDGIAETQDIGEGDGIPTTGEPNFDKTDVDESDQIGLTSFDYFAPANQFPAKSDEALWDKLSPGLFDTPSSISNGEPIGGEDGDFMYGSGFFPLRAGQTEYFSIALVYGDDKEDLLRNKKTVQNIYDNDYRFPPPPQKPTLTTIAGDNMVTLYWDFVAEKSVDPITKIMDFQGYKIYRATEPEFNDVFSITNGLGNSEGYVPLAQFDVNDDIEGFFFPSEELFQQAQGYSYYLGNNSGLQHTYIDEDVINGQKYYYSVVAYDNGDNALDIFPSENTKFISELSDGTIILDKNTSIAVPASSSPGYSLDGDIIVQKGSNNLNTGTINPIIIDPSKIKDQEYELLFYDMTSDSIDNNHNGLIDLIDPLEKQKMTTYYSVKTKNEVTVNIMANDTLVTDLGFKEIIESDFKLFDQSQNLVSNTKYRIDYSNGKIFGVSPGSLGEKSYTAIFNYYPIFMSPYIENTPWNNEGVTPNAGLVLDTQIFNGIRISFQNDWGIEDIESNSYWSTTEDQITWSEDLAGSTYFYSFSSTNLFNNTLFPTEFPNDYTLVFNDSLGFGHSYDLIQFAVSQGENLELTENGKTNFKIFNMNTGEEISYIFYDENVISGTGRNGIIDPQDIIYFYEHDSLDSNIFSWTLTFSLRQSHSDSTVLDFGNNDSLIIFNKKPYRKGDTYSFKTYAPIINPENTQESVAKKIRVVPNPYFSAHAYEAHLAPGITSGRGQRRVIFTNVPSDGKISIFTPRGQHVISLEHSGNIFNGSIEWNLKSKENLDVSYGVYYFVMESKQFESQSGKLAIIK
ncbi:MAG: hypothetical protein HN515_05370 [Candidatus Marinimicrobia bacterium]|nr:hypothetical protein [Candidatus Neomarinimicrobiota bacterium]MBT4055453.1 hypothetical protein [Candidatus Neomarinimicrobiota bacterium]MBT6981341.1 hypothetical protein [Candidatus Neomarinimicrobiota bacterium]